RLAGAVKLLGGSLLSPWATLRRLARRYGPSSWRRSCATPRRGWLREPLAAGTLGWLSYATLHGDKCVGPTLRLGVNGKLGHRYLWLYGAPVLGFDPTLAPGELELFLDGRPVARHCPGKEPNFRLELDITGLAPGPHELKMVSRSYVVPHDYLGNGDLR